MSADVATTAVPSGWTTTAGLGDRNVGALYVASGAPAAVRRTSADVAVPLSVATSSGRSLPSTPTSRPFQPGWFAVQPTAPRSASSAQTSVPPPDERYPATKAVPSAATDKVGSSISLPGVIVRLASTAPLLLYRRTTSEVPVPDSTVTGAPAVGSADMLIADSAGENASTPPLPNEGSGVPLLR